MNIGIDAKWYFEGPPSGKVVIRNLVDNLVKIKTDHNLFFFIDKNFISKFPYRSENIFPVGIWAKNNLVSNLFVVPSFAKKKKIDVLVYQNFPSFFQKYKQVAYIHDIIFLTHPQYYTKWEKLYFYPLKYLAPKSDLIFTVSNSEKERINKYYEISSDKISVLYHGSNNIFKPVNEFEKDFINEVKQKYQLPENYILYVGRLNVRKNIDNLLKGFSKIKRKGLKLVIVGDYDWRSNSVSRIIEENNLKDEIVFTGYVYNEELAAIYSLAKAFCFPSYEESFGLPPLEAMAAGVPVIVSDSSSLPEVCGEAGTYIEPDNPDDIAEKINLLLSNDSYRQKKIELGLKQAKKFSWETSAKKLLSECGKL